MERYNAAEINSRHAVFFTGEEQQRAKKVQYYDFGQKKWRDVELINLLPYDLRSYRFLDEPFDPKSPTNCVVTCKDSYRLRSKPNSIFNILPKLFYQTFETHIDEKERLWRDELTLHSELEYNNSQETRLIEVYWIKDDIIPGILKCKLQNSNIGIGYFHKDDKSLYPKNTFIVENDVSQSSLINNKLTADLKIRKAKASIVEWKQKLQYYKCFEFFDHRKWFETLKIQQSTPDADETVNKTLHNLLFLASQNGNVDVAFVEDVIEKSASDTSRKSLSMYGQIYFDITVENATYAKLYIFSAFYNYQMLCFDLTPSSTESEDGHTMRFTFPDFTISNPYFATHNHMPALSIVTDGTKITYKTGEMLFEHNYFLYKLNDDKIVNFLPCQNKLIIRDPYDSQVYDLSSLTD